MTRQHSNASSSLHIRFAWSNANHHVILHSASLHSGTTPVGEYEYHDCLLIVPPATDGIFSNWQHFLWDVCIKVVISRLKVCFDCWYGFCGRSGMSERFNIWIFLNSCDNLTCILTQVYNFNILWISKETILRHKSDLGINVCGEINPET